MNTLQWDDVRYFLTLSREGSLSASARVLKVEHSTVARHVGNLEKTLRVKLFDRLARGWVLTTEGAELSKQAEQLEVEMHSLWRAALANTTLSGKVRVSAPPILMSDFLVPRLPAFQEKYPDIELEVIGEARGVDLTRGEADIALRMGEPVSPLLVARMLCNVSYSVYGIPAWLERPESERSFIGLDQESPCRQKAWLESQVDQRRYALRTNDIRAMCHAAMSGIGLALLPRFMVAEDTRLVAIPMPETPPPCPLYLVMHSDVRRAPRIRATADFLIDLIQSQAHNF
ncbi:LysR family transcriptional regulator [Herbaspirillum seropedicae]|nr:LysR family transcriptional regulator [Herbaspirillum seropedicae]AKN66412.1 LysR family transcriptional regulator [Herbaspirillum seropedicae]